MKKLFTITILLLFTVSINSFAEKPEWVKEQQSQKASKHKVDAVEKQKGEDIDAESEDKDIEKPDKGDVKKNKGARGLEKQKAKKQEQVQKELDKGSEQGKEARSKRKKWWKFWE